MITAHNARSTRRRGSSNDGKNDPTRTFGIRSSMSPAGVDSNRDRDPLRWFERVSIRSCGSAPIAAVSSASISSCIPCCNSRRNNSRPHPHPGAPKVRNSGIIIMGHRVNTFLSEFFVVLTKGHTMAHPTGGPRRYLHHPTGRQR